MQPWMTLGASLAAKSVDYLVAPVGQQLRYLYQYKKNADNMRKHAERLRNTKEDVQQLVNAAKRNDEEIKSTVKSWLEEVDAIMAEAEAWNDETSLRMMCLPHLASKYKLSKVAVKKIMRIQELLGRAPKEDISFLAPPLNLPFISYQDRSKEDEVIEMGASSSSVVDRNVSENGKLTVDHTIVQQGTSVDEISVQQRITLDQIVANPQSKSMPNIIHQQREAVHQIIEELQDDEYKVIGICGMGGIGKTTLAKEVGKMARDYGIVAKVIMVVVSQKPNTRKIQGQIADMLGLRLTEESELGRAGRLFNVLSKDRVLLILDDVWSYIDLAEIGIPHGDEHKACRIMLTTRQKELCTAMGTKEIPLRLLSEEESSILLRKRACVGASSLPPELDDMVMMFVEECQGLPLALVTVGSALRGKRLVEWKAALQLLKKSQPLHTNTTAEKNIFSCLKLSYDYLQNEEIRLCFLMCCLFPEDHEINIEELTKYGVGKGMLSDIDTIEEARARVYLRVSELKASCLLLDVGKEGFVKMHDVVRDFAMSIASEGKHGFLVRAGHFLKEWPRRESFSNKAAVSFMSNDIHVLPQDLHCPNLQILLLGGNEGLEQIPGDFFIQMKKLMVLDLSERVGVHSLNPQYGLVPNVTRISTRPLRFPSSVEFLTNLRTLRLDHCRLHDVSNLGKLKRLEILSLYGSSIRELPKELGDLVNLRLLDLTFCQYLQTIPHNLISRFVELEELYMGGSFRRWRLADGSDEGSSQACLSELMLLPHLNILCVEASTLLAFPENFDLPNIQKFEITVGYNSAICYPNSRTFYFREIKTGIPNGVKGMLQFTEKLTVFCACKEILKSIFDVQGGLNHLKALEIYANEDITYLVENVLHSDAPVILGALETLHLRRLKDLFFLSLSQINAGSFQKLRIIKVEFCHRLMTVLTTSLLQRLSSLEEIDVNYCNMLFSVFRLDRADFDEEQPLLPMLKKFRLNSLPELPHIWRVSAQILPTLNLQKLLSLNNLTVVEISYCDRLRCVFPYFVAPNLCQLDTLKIVHCDKVERIIGEAPEGMLSNVQDGSVLFPNLRAVHVERCKKLRCLFSVTTFRSLCQLKELKVSELPNLVELISHEENGKEEEKETAILLPELKSLRITKSQNLEQLCKKDFTMNLPSLEEFVLQRCPKMADAVKHGLGSASNLFKLQIEEQSFIGSLAQQVFSGKMSIS